MRGHQQCIHGGASHSQLTEPQSAKPSGSFALKHVSLCHPTITPLQSLFFFSEFLYFSYHFLNIACIIPSSVGQPHCTWRTAMCSGAGEQGLPIAQDRTVLAAGPGLWPGPAPNPPQGGQPAPVRSSGWHFLLFMGTAVL